MNVKLACVSLLAVFATQGCGLLVDETLVTETELIPCPVIEVENDCSDPRVDLNVLEDVKRRQALAEYGPMKKMLICEKDNREARKKFRTDCLERNKPKKSFWGW